MKSIKTLLATAALMSAMSIAAGAHAATIAGLYSTGVDNSSVATVGNGADTHWTLNGGAAYTGGTNGSFPIGPWVSDSAASRWLTPTRNAADSFDPSANGFYSYATSFTLTAGQAAGAALTGQYAVDNTVADILLNGHSLGSGGGFTSWTGFAADASEFVAGVNTLEFVVENYQLNGGNPSGLNVQFLSSAAGDVPEPATWALMMGGVGLVGMSLRRQVRTQAATA
jgi:hypothetical protein